MVSDLSALISLANVWFWGTLIQWYLLYKSSSIVKGPLLWLRSPFFEIFIFWTNRKTKVLILICIVHSEYCLKSQRVKIFVTAKANFKGRCSISSFSSFGIYDIIHVWVSWTSQSGQHHQILEFANPRGVKPIEMTSTGFSLVLTLFQCIVFVILSICLTRLKTEVFKCVYWLLNHPKTISESIHWWKSFTFNSQAFATLLIVALMLMHRSVLSVEWSASTLDLVHRSLEYHCPFISLLQM